MTTWEANMTIFEGKISDDSRAAVIQVAAEVLEQQAFMFAEEASMEDLETVEEAVFRTSIAFTGPPSGGLCVTLPGDLSAELAVNILGVDAEDELEDGDAADAVKELVNVICGQLLTTMYGTEPVFQLTIPTVEDLDRVGWEAAKADRNAVALSVDESPVLVALTSDVAPQ